MFQSAPEVVGALTDLGTGHPPSAAACLGPELAPRTGVTTMGYQATVNLRCPKLSISEISTWILFGAGRVEEVLELGSTSRARLPAAVADTALAHLEKRLAAYVAG
jgi:hypothetical protein